MPDSAHHGRFIAATVSLSKDVAKSPVDCAKKFPSILKQPKVSVSMTQAFDWFCILHYKSGCQICNKMSPIHMCMTGKDYLQLNYQNKFASDWKLPDIFYHYYILYFNYMW